MVGESHIFITNLALACLSDKERSILFPRWGGIEAGATLSDHFRIMWEPEELNSKQKQLVHRCYIDSKNPKDHGCVTRAYDHADGSIAFIRSYQNNELDGYSEIEFLENLGMFLGVTSHHIADLCSPVHVGSKIDFKSLGYSSLSRFHNQVERDIKRYSRNISVKFSKPKIVNISKNYFWDIADFTYHNYFLKLENIYKEKNETKIIAMTSNVLSLAVEHTLNIWHTILTNTEMVKKKWSLMPLL